MLAYKGSGRYWNRHLLKHGKDVETIWYCLFTEKDELVKFALQCSEQWNIVNAKDLITEKKIWANEKPENGLDGGAWNKGLTKSDPRVAAYANTQTGKSKSSKGKKRKPMTDEHRAKIKEVRAKQVMKPHSEETKAKMRISAKNRRAAING